MLTTALEQSPHLLILGIAMFLLIAATSRKNRLLSIIAVLLLSFELARVHFTTSLSMIHYGGDLMLVSALAFFPFPKKRFDKFLFISIGMAALLTIHTFLPIQPIGCVITDGSMDQEYSYDYSGEIFIRFKDKSDLKKWIASNQELYEITYPAFKPEDLSSQLDEYAVVNLPDGIDLNVMLERFDRDPMIEYAEFNEQYELRLPSINPFKGSRKSSSMNDPQVHKQWAANKYDISKFHDKFAKAARANKKQTVTIAILDTGIDGNHEDLKDNYRSTSKSYDVDSRGHGTHCAGVAAAVTGNKIGIASWIPKGLDIKVTSIKVLGRFGVGTQRTIVNGILEAADKGYDVISLSLGGPSNGKREAAYNEAVAYANKKGSIVVIAAGNSNSDAINYSPANTNNVIAVSAVDTFFQKADFSNTTNSLKFGVAAPGTNIYSTVPKNRYEEQSGTSMAAPFVSGIIGLMKYYKKDLTTEEAYNLIIETSMDSDGLRVINPNALFERFFAENEGLVM